MDNSRDRLQVLSRSIASIDPLHRKGKTLPRTQHELISRLPRIFVCFALAFGANIAAAQKTVVEKNGLAGTIETDYNAAGKATEMRTIGADGKVQQRVQYEYLPGYYVPQQTDTTYWPNGRLRKVVRKNYDESANFTGEFIQAFDESGKQIGGHKLTHDPQKGTYRCADWNVRAEDYRSVVCPSGEEEGGGGGGDTAKKFTYDEVMKHLEAARKNAEHENTARGTSLGAPAPAIREVGLVLPSSFQPGERISGTLAENPEQFEQLPDVTVTRIRVPFESAGEASRLAGWRFEAPGQEPRLADGPLTLVVPHQGSLTVTLRQSASSAKFVSAPLDLSPAAAPPSPAPGKFEAPALCMKGELCVVSGRFSGDSSKTFAAFEERPATVLAETARAAYLTIPELTEPGPRPLFIAEGSANDARVVAFPVTVGKLFIRNNGREMQAGETVITFPTLEGPSALVDAEWELRDSAAEKIDRARRLLPEFSLNGELCESQNKDKEKDKGNDKGKEDPKQREPEAGTADQKDNDKDKDEDDGIARENDDDGKILLVIRNLAPGETSLHSSHNETVAFCLGDEAFQRGDFKYDLRVDARKPGKIKVEGAVIPFVAPVAGQELRSRTER